MVVGPQIVKKQTLFFWLLDNVEPNINIVCMYVCSYDTGVMTRDKDVFISFQCVFVHIKPQGHFSEAVLRQKTDT